MKDQWRSLLMIELKTNLTTGELFLQHQIADGISSSELYNIIQRNICKKSDNASKLKREVNNLADIREFVSKI